MVRHGKCFPLNLTPNLIQTKPRFFFVVAAKNILQKKNDMCNDAKDERMKEVENEFDQATTKYLFFGDVQQYYNANQHERKKGKIQKTCCKICSHILRRSKNIVFFIIYVKQIYAA